MSNLKRPYKYRVGQRRAIDWFFSVPETNARILDVGCGIGTGMKHLISKGYTDISGIDNDPDRVCFCKRRGLDVVCGDAAIYNYKRVYNIVWLSHSLEHFIYPDVLIYNLLQSTEKACRFYIIVPYPDRNPAELHKGSKELRLHIDDAGEMFCKWLTEHKLEVYKMKFDKFRESELWVKCVKA